MQISDETFAELMDANRASLAALNRVIEEYRSSKTDKWVNTTVAEKETGIPAYRIRYLARTDQIDSKKLGQHKVLVRIVDLEPYKK